MKKTKNKFLLMMLVSVLSLMPFTMVRAADDSMKVSISDPVLNVTMKPGESQELFFQYNNYTSEKQDLSFEVTPFMPSENGNGPNLFADSNGRALTSLSKAWFTLEKTSDTVEARSSYKVKFKVTIPSDAKKDKIHDAIFVNVGGSNNSNKATSSSQINYRIAALVNIDVDSKITDDAIAKNVKPITYKNDNANWYWYLIGILALLVIIYIIIKLNNLVKARKLIKHTSKLAAKSATKKIASRKVVRKKS